MNIQPVHEGKEGKMGVALGAGLAVSIAGMAVE